MDDCAFCQVAAGDRDAYVFYEDEETLAFLDANPAVHGHTLVVPKPHHEHLFTADASIAAAVFETLRTVALALHETMDADGVSVFYTSADLVGSMTHAHVHLVPRYVDDDIRLALERKPLDDEAAAELAARVGEHL